jgi:hypothetical protein
MAYRTVAGVVLSLIVAATMAYLPAQQASPSKPTAAVPAGKPVIVLWPNGAPGSEARKDEPETIKDEQVLNIHQPSLVAFLPPKGISTGVGMILAAGGGHASLYIVHEGYHPAEALAAKGIAVFVLKNRLQSSGYRFDEEGLADMQRAGGWIRRRSAPAGFRREASWLSWRRCVTTPAPPRPPTRSSAPAHGPIFRSSSIPARAT